MELVRLVGLLERAFTQDMRCGKCKQVRSDNVSRYCHCSGLYQLVLSKPEFRRRLRTIVNVAIVHNLSRLRVSYPMLLPTFTL
jgi:DNA polymerase epsilon subunit 1